MVAVKDVVMEPTMKTLSDDLVRPCVPCGCKCSLSSSTASDLSCRLQVLVHAWHPVL